MYHVCGCLSLLFLGGLLSICFEVYVNSPRASKRRGGPDWVCGVSSVTGRMRRMSVEVCVVVVGWWQV